MVDYYGQSKPPLRDDRLAGRLLIDKTEAGELNIAPAISPNGNYVAFLSQKNFFTIDLFLADARTGEILQTLFDVRDHSVTQLTDDWYSDIQAKWSGDGTHIVFVSDRPAEGGSYDQKSLQLRFLDRESKSVRILDIFHGAENFNPAFAPDDRSVYFLSNRDGFRNLYYSNYPLATSINLRTILRVSAVSLLTLRRSAFRANREMSVTLTTPKAGTQFIWRPLRPLNADMCCHKP